MDVPHAEQIRHTDIGQNDNAATANTLNCASSQNHSHVLGQSTDQTANKKGDVGKQNDRLASPDVTNLTPERDTGSICQQIR